MPNPFSPRTGDGIGFFLNYFLNRGDVLAGKVNDKIFPVTSRYNLLDLLRSHLDGEPTNVLSRNEDFYISEGSVKIGAYSPSLEGTTKIICIDFDGPGHASALKDPKDAVIKSYLIFREQGLPCYIESSSSAKGYHLWLFLSHHTSARLCRALCLALLPKDFELISGETADATSSKGLEVFPKANNLHSNFSVGMQVWLPWYNKAADKGSIFLNYQSEGLIEYVPDHFDKISPEKIQAVVDKFGGLSTIFSAKNSNFKVLTTDNETSNVWREWRSSALRALDLNAVYGDFLTEIPSGNGWLRCKDPWSDTGDQNPSAGVATGENSTDNGVAERATWHSFISGETLSVFDYLRRRGIVEDNHLAACRYISELTGIPLPSPNVDGNNNEDNNNNDNNNNGDAEGVSELPNIVVNNRQLRDVVTEAWVAVERFNFTGPYVFTKSGLLAELDFRDNTINIMSKVQVYGLLARVANWVRVGNLGFTNTSPVKDCAADMIECDHEIKKDLPQIENVVTTPIFSVTRELVCMPGYNKDAKVWFRQTDDLKGLGNIPLHPSDEAVENAKKLINEELLCDFPLVSTADTAHIYGAIFLPFVRQLIDGPTPLHVVEAPSPGTGKTKLCNLISIVCTGEMCEARTIPNNDEEIRKNLTSSIAKAQPIILFDNANEKRRLDSAAFASVLTSTKWTDRLLGESKMISLNVNSMVMLTGNNPQFSMEIARRCVRSRLDSRTDQPWRRTQFKHPNIEQWTKDNRSTLVRAILTLIQKWISDGCPSPKKSLGSYEQWSYVIGGILHSIGIDGFLANLEELYESSDIEGNEWRSFVNQWLKLEKDKRPMTAAELLDFIDSRNLLTNIIGEGTPRARQQRLVNAIHGLKERVILEHNIIEIKTDSPGGRFTLKNINDKNKNSINVQEWEMELNVCNQA